jgi:hypothetical protein
MCVIIRVIRAGQRGIRGGGLNRDCWCHSYFIVARNKVQVVLREGGMEVWFLNINNMHILCIIFIMSFSILIYKSNDGLSGAYSLFFVWLAAS